MKNPFFERANNITVNDILQKLNLKKIKNNFKIKDIKELDTAERNDISFFHSKKYLLSVKNTNSKIIVTSKKFKNIVPEHIKVIEVENVILSVSIITSLFYPGALDDNFDKNVKIINIKNFTNLKVGNNVLVGKNVKIGENCSIGHNTLIESNVRIGNNCKIGNNVIIKNSSIGNCTNILDGAILGKKGFGFFPVKRI